MKNCTTWNPFYYRQNCVETKRKYSPGFPFSCYEFNFSGPVNHIWKVRLICYWQDLPEKCIPRSVSLYQQTSCFQLLLPFFAEGLVQPTSKQFPRDSSERFPLTFPQRFHYRSDVPPRLPGLPDTPPRNLLWRFQLNIPPWNSPSDNIYFPKRFTQYVPSMDS